MMEYNDTPVGVNALIFNEKQQLLLGKRRNCFGEGKYGLIGGKLKKDENIEKCIIRELFEEIGIDVRVEDIEVINLSYTNVGVPMIQIGVLIKKYYGVPYNKETEYCSEIGFFDLENLPELFEVTNTNLQLYIKNEFYDRNCNI